MNRRRFSLIRGVLAVSGLACACAISAWANVGEAMYQAGPLSLKSTADHKKFKELNEEFQSAQEVTKACLKCHTEAAKQLHSSIHWRWAWERAGGIGKKNAVNNF
ncbi:MAG: hypothetical protein PHC35_06750 [Deltaproteobacteria bacterium]|nr:hypothetical protein [Deltaproteobacteria bacterium]